MPATLGSKKTKKNTRSGHCTWEPAGGRSTGTSRARLPFLITSRQILTLVQHRVYYYTQY